MDRTSRTLALAVIVLGLIGSACPAWAGRPVLVSGGTRSERAALAGALERLRSRVTAVEIAPGPFDGYHGHRTTLRFRGPADPQSRWKDEIATGVYESRGFPAHWVAIPGAGSAHYGLARGMKAIGRKRLVRTLLLAARRSDARIDRIELLKPLALAPVVTVTARKPVEFERRGLRLGSLLDGSHPRLEGIFLIVRGPHGRVMTRGGIAFRVGAGAGRWPGAAHGGITHAKAKMLR